MSKFITFEGCDGSGKSTQASLLAKALDRLGKTTWLTKEVGGTELANKIRSLLLDKEIEDGLTELLLISAARRDHCQKIRASLLTGYVISDRYIDSSIVYQCYAKEVNILQAQHLIDISTDSLKPDLTILLDVDIDCQKKHLETSSIHNNFYDKKNALFQQKIIDGFSQVASQNTDRIVVIAGGNSIERVHQSVLEACKKFKIISQ